MELKEAWKFVLRELDMLGESKSEIRKRNRVLERMFKENIPNEYEDHLIRFKQAVEMLEEVYQADM